MRFEEWSQIEEVIRLIEEKFVILDKYISERELVFTIDEKTKNIKEKFVDLYYKLKSMECLPVLRMEEAGLTLRVIKGFKPSSPKRSFLIPILFVATIVTTFLDGYIRVTDPLWAKVSQITHIYISPLMYSTLFLVAMMGIIVVHEVGHLTTLKLRKLESSPPYFLPGLPGFLPTFGAVILQREPAVNRDQLFDLGLTGPIFGLLATLVVSIFSTHTMVPLTAEIRGLTEGRTVSMTPPILFSLILLLFKPQYLRSGVLIDPISWAAIVGMIITFLNTLPAWELDGGHMSRAVLGPKYSKVATFITILLMTFLGYLPMAMMILIFWMMSGGAQSAPLDDYSAVSSSKKILFAASIVIAFLCMPLPF